MDSIRLTLDKYKIETSQSKRSINNTWEVAKEFGEYVGLSTPIVLRLFKIYGKEKTLSIRSWLYDIPCDPNRGGKVALAHWKLKQA